MIIMETSLEVYLIVILKLHFLMIEQILLNMELEIGMEKMMLLIGKIHQMTKQQMLDSW